MHPNSSKKVTLSELVCQAFEQVRAEVLESMKVLVEQWLEQARDELVGRGHYARAETEEGYRRWGYRVRKGFETVLGRMEQIRVPRVRTSQGEVPLLADRYERRSAELCNGMLQAYLGGMSLRSLSVWYWRSLGHGVSPSAISGVVSKAIERLYAKRESRLCSEDYAALVVDGVWWSKRGRNKAKKRVVVLVAVGVRHDGSHEVLDWLGVDSESYAAYVELFNRLYHRGLEEVDIVVGDGAEAIFSAAQTVYPGAEHQECLYHVYRRLRDALVGADWRERRRFGAEYWDVFNGPDLDEVLSRAKDFVQRWRQSQPEMCRRFVKSLERGLTFLKLPYWWNYRVRTTNLAEGFFGRLQTFVRRFPGFADERHAANVLGLYLLGRQDFLLAAKETPYALQLNFNTIS
jgi:transposase-like protein